MGYKPKGLTERQVIESVKTVNLTENDILLVKLPNKTSPDSARAISESFKASFAGRPVKPMIFFYIGDMDFSKISLDAINNQNKEDKDEEVID